MGSCRRGNGDDLRESCSLRRKAWSARRVRKWVFTWRYGRSGPRIRRWHNWAPIHMVGMSGSYIFLLIAFYVDNGRNLPIWKNLPPITYWLLPTTIGIPLIMQALLFHPLARGFSNVGKTEGSGGH